MYTSFIWKSQQIFRVFKKGEDKEKNQFNIVSKRTNIEGVTEHKETDFPPLEAGKAASYGNKGLIFQGILPFGTEIIIFYTSSRSPLMWEKIPIDFF